MYGIELEPPKGSELVSLPSLYENHKPGDLEINAFPKFFLVLGDFEGVIGSRGSLRSLKDTMLSVYVCVCQ